MQSSYYMEGKSRKDLRQLGMAFKQQLGLHDVLYFPVVEVLELMPIIFKRFSFEVVDDNVFEEGIHADTDVINHHMRIRNSVYEGACEDCGRDRMTIGHELGHYVPICANGYKLTRNFSNFAIPPYKDPEWQAKCFAGELLVPRHLVVGMNEDEIMKQCGVSRDAAIYQIKVNGGYKAGGENNNQSQKKSM